MARSWWGQRDLGVDVLEAARERVRRAFREFDHVFVSFSGGKDSTAVLNVTLEVARELGKLPLRVVFYDEECIATETSDYMHRVRELPEIELEWYCLPLRSRNACSRVDPLWFPWDPAIPEKWCRPLPECALQELDGFTLNPPEQRPSHVAANPLLAPYSKFGRSVMLMGIRAQESPLRRRAVSNHRADNWMHQLSKSMWKAYPVYDWTTDDVWLAPQKLDWDYNEAYDVMEMGGVARRDQRLAPPFGEEPLQMLWMWAHCFPDIWDKMSDRVPGAATAAMYSKSELYSYGSRSPKPSELTWHDFLLQRLGKHDPEIRATIAHKLRTMIRKHYSKTKEPIAVATPHPDSGLSWNLLLFVADRGDLKDRRTGAALPTGDAYPRARVRYDAEIREDGVPK